MKKSDKNPTSKRASAADHVFNLLIKLRFIMIALSVVLFFYFGFHMKFITQNSSAKIDSVLAENDKVLQQYNQTKEIFPLTVGQEKLFIVFETESVYSNHFLIFLNDAINSVSEIDGVNKCNGIFSTYNISGEDNELVISPFAKTENLPFSESQLKELRAKIEGNPMTAGRLANSEATCTTVILSAESGLNDEKKQCLYNSVQNILYQKKISSPGNEKISIHYAGDMVIQQEISLIQSEEKHIFPIMILTVIIILFAVFRTLAGVLIPVSIMIISVTTTIGVKALCGSSMSAIDPMLYALITTISVADSIHFVSSYYNPVLFPLLKKRERIIQVMRHSIYPCFLTSLTTAIGFFAITLSPITQLKSFGLYASTGVMISFAYTVILVPGALCFFDFSVIRHRFVKTNRAWDNLLSRIIDYLSYCAINKYKKTILIFGIIFILSAFFTVFLKTGTNPYSFLKDSHRVNKALSVIEKNFGGIDSIDIIIQSENPDVFKQKKIISQLDHLINNLSKTKGIEHIESFVPLLKQMNSAIYSKQDQSYRLPDKDELIPQYFLLYEMSDDSETLYTWVNSDYSTARIRLTPGSDSNIRELTDQINTVIKESGLDSELDIVITGSAVLWNHVDSQFIKGQLLSLLFSISLITALLFLIFRSVRLGLCAVAVNIFPIIFGLGFMGLFGIKLSMGTVMIASIAIGIAVDDTIHTIFKYKILSSQGEPFNTNIHKVFGALFRPVVFTSLILAAGFLSNTMSAFKPNAWFGLISAIVIIIAMLADIFLLPALLRSFAKDARTLHDTPVRV